MSSGTSAQVEPIRRRAGAFSALRIALNLAFGALAAAFLAWGPLALPWPWIIALALVGGLLNGGLWAWSEWAALRGQREVALRRRWGLLLVHLAIGLSVAFIAALQLYQVGYFPPLSEDRVAGFERLWQAVDRHYAYAGLKDLDWRAVHDRYLPRVQAARTGAEYDAAIRDMLAELDDAHTGLVSPSSGGLFALTKEIEGQAVVTQAGETARGLGLEPGARILAVNGRSLEEALAALPAYLCAGSTPRQRRYSAFRNLLTISVGETLHVRFETPAGEERSAALTWPSERRASSPGTGPLVTGERLPSGLGRISIPTFAGRAGHDLVAEFDAALDSLQGAPGLILDLRGNGGGDSFLADCIAGRFLEQPFTYGREHYRSRLPLRGWRPWWDYRVIPRGWIYDRPLVLLIDEGNMSTAETFIVSLADSRRAHTVGRRTGGSSGNPVTFYLPGGGRARFSTGAFRRNDGTLIEGVGITPDVEVVWTMADLREGRDPDLLAAEQFLLERIR